MTTLPRHTTKTDLALQILRERISGGQLRPGERLRLDVLKEQLGMSPTPIREALRLLQADGLVDYRPHQGMIVADISVHDVAKIYLLRSVLEPLAVELAVPSLEKEHLEELERLYEAFCDAIHSGRGTAISGSNAEWHSAIYARCGSGDLKDFIRQLWARFPWRTMWVLPGRIERSLEEHGAVMAAIRAGNAKQAADRMRAHILSGENSLLERMAEQDAES